MTINIETSVGIVHVTYLDQGNQRSTFDCVIARSGEAMIIRASCPQQAAEKAAAKVVRYLRKSEKPTHNGRFHA